MKGEKRREQGGEKWMGVARLTKKNGGGIKRIYTIFRKDTLAIHVIYKTGDYLTSGP